MRFLGLLMLLLLPLLVWGKPSAAAKEPVLCHCQGAPQKALCSLEEAGHTCVPCLLPALPSAPPPELAGARETPPPLSPLPRFSSLELPPETPPPRA